MAVTTEYRTDPARIGDQVDATGWPILPPTLVTIHRTSWIDEGSRQIVCSVDGERSVQLLHGQTHTREIPPGPHTLRVHNTLIWKTISFDVPPGGHVHYTVWNRACFGYYTLIFFIGAAPLWLELAAGPPAVAEQSDAARRTLRGRRRSVMEELVARAQSISHPVGSGPAEHGLWLPLDPVGARRGRGPASTPPGRPPERRR